MPDSQAARLTTSSYVFMMFAIVYEWAVAPEREQEFIDGWGKATQLIREQCGSFGSRLHRTERTRWVAYARWPSLVFGLRVLTAEAEADFTVLSVPDGSTVEVFGPASPHNRHLVQPVAGFRVRDLATAHEELVAAGVEIVLPIQGGDDRRWLHARGPDGFLYELVEAD